METFGVNLSLAGLSVTIQLGATGLCMFIGSFIQDKLGVISCLLLKETGRKPEAQAARMNQS